MPLILWELSHRQRWTAQLQTERIFYSSNVVSDKTHKMGSYLAAQTSPSDQTLSSFASLAQT